MRTLKATLVLMFLPILPTGDASAQLPLDERRPASEDGTVKITSAVGSVRVVGWDQDSVAITGTLGQGAERLDFSTNERETRIRVLLPKDAHEVGSSDLEVRVPHGSHVAVRTSSADIEIAEVNGALDLESVSGGIRVSGRPRMLYAESAGGDVEVDVQTKVVRAKSVGGNVTVRRAIGYVEVSTVSGDAFVEGRSIWEGEVTSVAGSIHFEGDFDSGGSFYFESHSGTIELLLPSHIAADFDVTTMSGGQVENDFAPSRERTFSTGGGGTQIKIKSFKGVIRILEQS